VFHAATGFELKDYLAFGVGVFVWFNEQSYLRNTYSVDRESINPGTFLSQPMIDGHYLPTTASWRRRADASDNPALRTAGHRG
jgi:hypothetical protein